MSSTGPFEDSSRAERLFENILSRPFAKGKGSAIRILIAAQPDPDAALINLSRFLENALKNPPVKDLDELLSNRENLETCLAIFSGSQFLSNCLIKNDDRIFGLLRSDYLKKAKPFSVIKDEIFSRTSRIDEMDTLMKFIRTYRDEEFLRIAARDFTGAATIEETTLEISNLATVCTEFGLQNISRLMAGEFGEPMDCAPEGEKEIPSGFVVMGMGKLGGNELNYSSDIDLIFLHSSDQGRLVNDTGRPGAATKEGLVLHQYFTKLSETLTRVISEVTDDGFAFRVDLNLRPEGGNGPITNSLDAALSYYEVWGQTWERTALIKARPIAGSILLGDRFLAAIEPFIYRRHLDYTVLDDLKEMKNRINLQVKRSTRRAWDIKLGSGGIREIEFFVQTLLMIHAGKNRSIRERNTLKAIDALLKAKLVPEKDAQVLKDAYTFHRGLEHMVQVWEFRQTQKLPTSMRGLARVAMLMGFEGSCEKRVADFESALSKHKAAVEAIFDGLFYEPSRKVKATVAPDVSMIFFEDISDEEAVVKLEDMGFKSPEAALKNLRRFKVGPRGSVTSRRSSKLLNHIVPMLFTEIISAPDPDMALINCEKFLARVGARSTTLSLLGENPATAKFIIDLFGTSDYLSNFFIAHPELLDSLVTPRGMTESLEEDEMTLELEARLNDADDFEEVLGGLRSFVKEKTLKVGLMDIGGELPLEGISKCLTNIALVIIRAALKVALTEIEKRYGKTDAQFAIVGMGKFGAGELSYGSDLDVIFIYSPTGGEPDETIGSISIHEYFAKLAQRIISVITVETREGHCYRLDTRLRPSGMAGPLVSSIASFEKYHSGSSRLWERQAMTRAKIVATTGDGSIAKEVSEVARKFAYSSAAGLEEAREVREMKEKMERELSEDEPGKKLDIKFGRGGIVDIEFITQFLLLKYGADKPDLRRRNTLDALKSLKDVVADPLILDDLIDAHRLLSTVSMRLRIVHDQPDHVLKVGAEEVTSIARRMHHHVGDYDVDSASDLIELVESHRTRVREIYEAVLAKE